MDYGALVSTVGDVLTKQPSTSGAGGGGPQNYAGGGSSSSNASGGLNAGSDFGGASLSGSASSSASGGSGGGGGGAGGGGGYSGAVADQRQLLSSLKSENKNKLATNLDYSGNAGQRGSSFNFGGTQTNAALGAGGGTVKWIVAAIVGVVVLGGLFLWKRR